MADPRRCPFVLDFQNGQEVEDILKKAQNLADIQTIGNGLLLDETGELSASIDSYTKEEMNTLLDGKADLVDGKVPAAQLPSYVDDVVEYSSTSAFPVTGESGKIYVATDTNKTYRWSGSAYVEISESLALGETASTAYPGNKGKANADAIAKKPGEITTGKQYTISGQTVTAGAGAEAFNDLVNNKAAGEYSHAEGYGTTASGSISHVEGSGTNASGYCGHAEGYITKASGYCGHAEGYTTNASGYCGHAEGIGSIASGNTSHAEGGGTVAFGTNSHSEGLSTKSSSDNQHVQGKYNVEDSNGTFSFIIGNGTADNARHNAFAVDWSGLIYVNGAATGVDVSALPTVNDFPSMTQDEYDALPPSQKTALYYFIHEEESGS